MPETEPRTFRVGAVARLLWRGRLSLAIGAWLALAAATLMVFRVEFGLPPEIHERSRPAGEASTSVLLDTSSSKAVDLTLDPDAIDIPGLIQRARLLGNLLATSPLRDEIARRAGVDPATFVASAPAIGVDGPQRAKAVPGLTRMVVGLSDAVPIVTIESRAPTEAGAIRVSTAAAAVLKDHVASLAEPGVSGSEQPLLAQPLGQVDHRTVLDGTRRGAAVLLFLVLFGCWCAGTVVLKQMRRREPSSPDDGPFTLPSSWAA